MSKLEFNAVIDIRDGNPFILVSPDQVALLHPDWRKPMPVLVQINGQPKPAWQINMMPAGDGSFYLYLHGDVRKASQTKVGDMVEVRLEFDATYQNGPIHPMPEWFEVALEANPVAQQNWDALPPSRQKEIVRYFSWLKGEEAIERNLEKALHVLSGKSGRFMARSWVEGK